MPLQSQERQSASAAAFLILRRRWILAAVLLLLVGLTVAFVELVLQWPFTESAVIQSLQQQSGSKVQIASFQRMYFPHPGCRAQELTFRRQGNATPLVTINKLTIMGSYQTLVFHHITIIRAEQLRVTIPARGKPAGLESTPIQLGMLPSGLTIGRIIADGAEVEFLSAQPGKAPLVFQMPKLALHDLAAGQPLLYQASIRLPLPPADVDLQGKFHPFPHGNVAQTNISGTFHVENMNLGTFRGIAGTLASKGSFDGPIQHILVQGATDAPNFQVTSSGHPLHLVTRFQALVNGMNGDVALDSATVQFGRSVILASGEVASQKGRQGKTANIGLSSDHARVQDLLWLFVNGKEPAMTGAIIFRARAVLPPENRPFIDKVRLQGDFGITGAEYPHRETQKTVDVLSARARGKADQVEDRNDKLGNDSYDPGRVLSNIKGQVALQDADAHLRNISFDVPGAAALVSGTYDLKTKQIDLKGKMHLDTQLSKATTGVKSFLLEVLHPLASSEKHQGSMVSLKIGGTYDNPEYRVLPTTKKQDVTLLGEKRDRKAGEKGR
jgi:hypothetical protein